MRDAPIPFECRLIGRYVYRGHPPHMCYIYAYIVLACDCLQPLTLPARLLYRALLSRSLVLNE